MSIKFEEVSHIYSSDTPFSYTALNGVNLNINGNMITAIIGKTGSGKSTLIQHLNALLLPSSGKLEILDRVIVSSEKPKKLKSLRKQVGLVFQFPEYQLFEETILKDVSFGPKNFGVSEIEAIKKAKVALGLVGLDESYYERSPLDLSGGQKRRVAIAGILAMEPSIIVLDEPTAGLDPQGAKQIMTLFKELNKKYNKTVLIVTHDMNHVLEYCDDVVVMSEGTIKKHQSIEKFFSDFKQLDELGVVSPLVIDFKRRLIEEGFKVSMEAMSLDDIAQEIKKQVTSNE
ncbi:MAG: energy-coupling factor transporter ATPase [Anaerorhabdus sp.]